MIAKLPPSWRNFATSLKHKRTKISVESLTASLDVEEKARAKDTGKGAEGQSSANMAQKFSGKGKGKNKLGMNKTTEFKKKKNNKEEEDGSIFLDQLLKKEADESPDVKKSKIGIYVAY